MTASLIVLRPGLIPDTNRMSPLPGRWLEPQCTVRKPVVDVPLMAADEQ